MGGGSDAATNVDSIQSPRRVAAIDKAESELRQELAGREQLKRELTYLEKGGNPLDFKFCDFFPAGDLLSSDLCVRNTFEANESCETGPENGKYLELHGEDSSVSHRGSGEEALGNGFSHKPRISDGPLLRDEAPGAEGRKAQKKLRNNNNNWKEELDENGPGVSSSSSPRKKNLIIDSDHSSMCRFQIPPTCSADVREIGTCGDEFEDESLRRLSEMKEVDVDESFKLPAMEKDQTSGDGVKEKDQTLGSSGEVLKEKGGNEEEIVSAAAKKAQEDVILEEAEAMKASRKQTAELARRKAGAEPPRRKSHWDFVLEEMAWLANDFMQERLWKTAAAAQVSRWAQQKTRETKASEAELKRSNKRVAQKLADIVTQYWRSAAGLKPAPPTSKLPENDPSNEPVPMEIDNQNTQMNNSKNENDSSFDKLRPLQKYVQRRAGDMMEMPSLSLGVAKADLFFVDSYPEESLFFVVPEGAFEAYRVSIEKNWENLVSERLMHESFSEQKPGTILELYGDSTPKPPENDFGLDYMPGELTFSKKKRKKVLKTSAPKPLELPGFSQGDPTRVHSPVKRPTPSSIGVIPTKRMRSSAVVARQRAASAALSPGIQRGASSASTNEDLLGFPESRISESDSVGPSRKAALALKKKKKKARAFLGDFSSSGVEVGASAAKMFDPLQTEAESQQESLRSLEQDHFKRKNDQFSPMSSEHADTPETPGSQGLMGMQPAKKLKTSKHSPDFAEVAPSAMQTSAGNSNSRLLRQNSRIRRNKTKGHFVQASSNPPGVGVPWSTIEDQAILALVHDLGPNWELVTDVLSSSSQLKGVFRKPKDCKERHKFLLERLSIENGENIEDPGTSSWPGIARGNARSILQRLQGPMEEDTVKVHFERIVNIVQNHRSRQQADALDNQELVPVHQSHSNVASQFPLLSPLDLCEHPMSNGEIPGHGYPPLPHPGLSLPGVLAANGMRPNAAGLPLLPIVSPNSAAMNAAAARDAQRMAASMSAEEQRMRYTRMLAGRSLQPQGTPSTPGSLSLSNLPTSSECSVAMLPAGSPGAGAGLMNLNRGLALPRPALPGIMSPALNSPGLMPGMPTSGPMMAGTPPSFMKRSSQMIRPGRTVEEQKQQHIMQMQELQHQAAQGNPQAVAALNNINSMNLSNPLVTSPTQSFAPQQQQQHLTPQQNHHQQQHQAYLAAVRLVNERQQQQQHQQQHHQLQHQQKRMFQAQSPNNISPGLMNQQALGLQGGSPLSPTSQSSAPGAPQQAQAQTSSQPGQASSLQLQQHQQQQQTTKAQVPPKQLTKQPSFHQHQLLQGLQASKVGKSSPGCSSPAAAAQRGSSGSSSSSSLQGLKPGLGKIQQAQKAPGKQTPAASPVPAAPSTPPGASTQQQMPGSQQMPGALQRRQQQQQQQQQQQSQQNQRKAQQKAQSSSKNNSGFGAATNLNPGSWKPGQSFTPSYNLTRGSPQAQAQVASNGSLVSSGVLQQQQQQQQQAGKIGVGVGVVSPNGRSSSASTSAAATSSSGGGAAAAGVGLNPGVNQRVSSTSSAQQQQQQQQLQQAPAMANSRASTRPSLIPQAPVGPAFQGSQSNPMLVYGVQPRPVAPLQRATNVVAAAAGGSSSSSPAAAAAAATVVSSSSLPR